jgi:hypothetical protein
LLCQLVPRQQKAAAAVKLIQETVEQLVAQCKEIVEAENERLTEEEYVNESDPSVLRFLLASREEVGREGRVVLAFLALWKAKGMEGAEKSGVGVRLTCGAVGLTKACKVSPIISLYANPGLEKGQRRGVGWFLIF